jgi:hypothetical protein
MPKYSKSIIYRIVCKDLSVTDCYVGSTTNFKRRRGAHKCRCNNPNDKAHNLMIYKFIREHGGWENWDMIMVEEFPCDNKLQLHKREREVIEQLTPTLNSEIPSRTQKEYREDNKEKIKEFGKQYYQDNKQKILQQRKQYELDNKQKIKERECKKIECPICKCMVKKYQFKRHTKTTKHINNLP